MALADLQPRIAFAGSGTRGPFNLTSGGSPIPFAASSHIRAIRYDVAGGAVALTDGIHYDSALTAGTWSITLRSTQAVLAVGEVLVVDRNQPFSQDLDLVAAETFPAESVEARLDRIVQYCQDLSARVGRGVTVHPMDAAGLQLPNAQARQNALFGWDGSGNFRLIPQASFAASGVGSPPMSGTAQPLDASLTGLAALPWNVDQYAYGTGVDTFALGTVNAAGRSILAAQTLPTGFIPSSARHVGYMGYPIIRSVTSATTLDLADAGGWLISGTGSAVVVALPANATAAIPIGVPIMLSTLAGGGGFLVQPASGATLTWLPSGATGNRTLAGNALCWVMKTNTNDWVIYAFGGVS